MKKALFVLVALFMFSISCNELDQFTMFDIEYSMSLSIPGLLKSSVPIEIWAPPIATHSDSIFNRYQTSAGMIEEVTLTQMRLVMASPAGSTFGFLNSIAFSLASENQTEKEIAWKYDIPKDATDTLMLETTPDDLRFYITEDTLRLKASLLVDSLLHLESVIKMDLIFHVDAKILGI